MKTLEFQPRIIRAGQAYRYCGMSREIFNEQIRPFVSEIPIGEQGKGFDRLELDAALDEYISRRGRAPARKWSDTLCQNGQAASSFAVGSTTSRRDLTDGGFEKALERAIG